MKINVDISKAKKEAKKLNKFVEGIGDVVMSELTRAAIESRNKIIKSIQRGKKTGKTYTWRGLNPGETPDGFQKSPLGHLFPVKKRNKPHRASAPGEAPANDTGELAESIRMDSRRDEIEVGSGISDPPYPEFLEEGTRAMKARPFMKPVVDDLKKELPDKVMSAIINSARRV